ncbi:GNAT family N-acetyltransferase [Muriicola soli]|uniref:GNAT family N-acetyltransferase n=1 Tax=Muriicola soli TaxID=2507538 RepID=A0A411E8T2_9FLAO|nr:GNAT family N-acetyltransferase [Muriicola soli]QBA63870.1 GNAT family N-acetyltransferase [Muriicola soli]
MEKYSFLLDFVLKEKQFPFFIKGVKDSTTSEIFEPPSDQKSEEKVGKMLSIYDLPGYYSLEKKSDLTALKKFESTLYHGYAVELFPYENFEDYLWKHVRKARYSQLRRYKKRLDKCLNPGYKVYCGSIDKEEYDLLFEALKDMIERRFQEKEETNFELPYLDLYQSVMYPLILKGKAALFVIYSNSKPICITLNFLHNKVLFHWNSAYDIDYAMFNVGHINTFNHLEWAFKHKFDRFDMGRGDFFHKRKWINTIYCYKQVSYVPDQNILYISGAAVRSHWLTLRFHLINLLKRFRIHLAISKFRKKVYRFKNSNNTVVVPYDVRTLEEGKLFPSFEGFTTVNPYGNSQLLRALNYFLHQNQENFAHVKVYRQNNTTGIYIFQGENNYRSVEIVKLN